MPRSRLCRAGRQAGFSLVEVSIVSAIVLLISMFAIPAIGSYIIENKVPKVGEALQRFIAGMKINAEGAGTTPYASVGSAVLANALSQGGVFTVTGDGASALVAHGLGGSGSGTNGVLTLAPAATDGGANGSAFRLTLSNVNHAACPALASVLHQATDAISITGSSGGGEVMNRRASPAVAYNALLARSYCSSGDVNTFVFTVQ